MQGRLKSLEDENRKLNLGVLEDGARGRDVLQVERRVLFVSSPALNDFVTVTLNTGLALRTLPDSRT